MIQKKTIFVAVTNDVSTDQRVHKVCDYLVRNGFEVLVYGRVLPDTFLIDRSYTIKRKKHWFHHNFMFYAEYNIKLFLYLLVHKYDYILSNDLDTLPACFFGSKLKKTSLVYDSHELFSEGPELQGRKFVQGFWRRLENYFLPKLKNAYTVSNSIADFYKEKHQIEMGVIRNVPLLEKEFAPIKVSFPTKNKVVLYQGVLNPGRGIKSMIKALHFLDKIDLVIIGFGKVEEELKAFAKKEKLKFRVHFLGRIPHNALKNYTTLADIGMVLEMPLGKSFEFSLPNKLFDYIHAGLPIICGNLPEISNIVRAYKVGEIIENPTPENIAKAIKEITQNNALEEYIIENQQKAAKELCWEKERHLLDNYFR